MNKRERPAGLARRKHRTAGQKDKPGAPCRGAIYARTATPSAERLQEQVRRCRRWAREHGIHVDDGHVFMDDGVSGNTMTCPGLTALSGALEAGVVDVVIVTNLTRIGRQMRYVHQFVLKEVIRRGGSCVVIDAGCELTSESLMPLTGTITVTTKRLSNVEQEVDK